MSEYVRTVTQKGQVTVPAAIRRALRLQPKDQLKFHLDDGGVRIERAESNLLSGYRAVKLRGGTTDLKRLRRETEVWVAEQALAEE